MRLIIPTLLLILTMSCAAAAKVAAPAPPPSNPHAPTTAADKARVDAATLAVERFLKNRIDGQWLKKGAGTSFHSKDVACLKSASCWRKDKAFAANIRSIVGSRGRIVSTRHAHIIPWSMDAFRKHKGPHHHHSKHVIPKMNRGARLAPMQMKAPKLKNDEYMVHAYVRFENTGWHHLDVVMTEGADGKPKVRYFFTAAMVSRGGSLPPGVRC
jgi:hypothetical protein